MYTMLCYAILCYVMLCYGMLCYVMHVYSVIYIYIYIDQTNLKSDWLKKKNSTTMGQLGNNCD